MKTATVTEVGLDFPRVLKWVETGEEVQVVREGKPVTVISPAPRPVKHPDYLARLPHGLGGHPRREPRRAMKYYADTGFLLLLTSCT
jgi:antitoxin (DNA-binding transcriptional repressor) of toxin-antitoxin stability system